MQYEVLSPWADSDRVEPMCLNSRVGGLNGITVGLFAGFKGHWVIILREVERQLQERFPGAKFSHYHYPKDMSSTRDACEVADDDEYRPSFEKWLKDVDTVVSGHGDAASCALTLAYNTAFVEKMAKPAVMLVNKDLVTIARTGASVRDVPGLRLVQTTIPDLSAFFSFEGVVEDMIRPGVAAVIDDVVAALTQPLTQEEDAPAWKVGEAPRIVFRGSLEDVNRFFYQRGWAFGMPIMPPTEEAVREMLAGTDLPADHVVARIPPMSGKATVEKIAVNAVMAGCLPTYLPVLIAAVQALADRPKIWLEGYTCSVASWAPILCVNGPVRNDLHINRRGNLMSPYYRANAGIGHALGLIIMNIGGTRPGMEDLSFVGHEGRYGMCFAENEEESAWEPLHVGYGFNKEDSTVTLFWTNGRQYLGSGGNAATILRRLCDNINVFAWDPGCLLIMLPSTAKALADAGLAKKDVISYLVEYARLPAANVNVRWFKESHHEPKDFLLPLDDPTRSVRKFYSGKHTAIVVAGLSYSWGTVSYSGGGTHGTIVTKKLELPANWGRLVAKYEDIVPAYAPY
jgi:hypothetical protein